MLWRETLSLGWAEAPRCYSLMDERLSHTGTSSASWSCLDVWTGYETDPGGLMSAAGSSTVSVYESHSRIVVLICTSLAFLCILCFFQNVCPLVYLNCFKCRREPEKLSEVISVWTNEVLTLTPPDLCDAALLSFMSFMLWIMDTCSLVSDATRWF